MSLSTHDAREVRRRGVRVLKLRPAAAHSSTQSEAALLRTAARAQLAPRVLAVRRDGEVSVLELERVGHAFPTRPTNAQVAMLAAALKSLHRLAPPPGVDLLTVPAELERYARECIELAERVAPGWVRPLSQGLVPWARGLDHAVAGSPPALCHGDVKPSNLRLRAGQVVLVDFEAARLAEPAWELANAALTLQLTAEGEDAMLAAYAEPAERATLAARFHALRLLGLVFFPLDALDRLRSAARSGQPFQGRSMLALQPLHAARAQQVLSALCGRRVAPLVIRR